MTRFEPLKPYEIRDINREIQERLSKLTPAKELVVVKSYKKGKCYGIGLNNPKKDLILRNLVRVMGALYRPRPAADLTTTVTLYDITNTARTVRIHYASGTEMGTFTHANIADTNARGGTLLGFGNPATAPTPARTDYELASKVAEIVPSETTTDETNWRVVVTGSYVWTDGGTVRETGMYAYWADSVPAWRTFLIYHDAVSDVTVPAGGTVSVTYTTQF